MRLSDLAQEWLTRAEIFREHAEDPVAIAYERCAHGLEEVLAAEGDEVLTLQQAAAESGYSADHLGRLVREGKIPNAGRPNAPRIARRKLLSKSNPTTPLVAEDTTAGDTSFEQIVQSIIERGTSDGTHDK